MNTNEAKFVTTSEAAHIHSWAEFDRVYPGKKACPNLIKLINHRDGEETR